MAQILLDAKNNKPDFNFPASNIYCEDGKNVETKISTIIMNNTNLGNRVSSLETNSVQLSNKITANTNSIGSINTKITNLQNSGNTTNTAISNINKDISAVNTSISNTNKSVSALDTKLTNEINTIKKERLKGATKIFTLSTSGWAISALSPYTFQYRITDAIFKANMISPIESLKITGTTFDLIKSEVTEHGKIVRMITANGYCMVYTLGNTKPNRNLSIIMDIFTV